MTFLTILVLLALAFLALKGILIVAAVVLVGLGMLGCMVPWVIWKRLRERGASEAESRRQALLALSPHRAFGKLQKPPVRMDRVRR